MRKNKKCGCGRKLTERDAHTYDGCCEVCYAVRQPARGYITGVPGVGWDGERTPVVSEPQTIEYEAELAAA